MENLPAQVPQALFPDLISAFLPPDTPTNTTLELVVTVEAENIPAREFATYLALVDRLYGRLSEGGLMSYAHREWGRLKIAEIHKNDLEIIFRVPYGTDAATIIIILIFLRSLPNMFKLGSEGVKNLADAYKSYEEGRFTRENRKRVRDIIKQEPALEQLAEPRKSQLVTLLDALFVEENPYLPGPLRFARRQVRSLVLRIRKES